MDYKGYSKTRFNENTDRKIVWGEIARFVQRYIKPDSTVLELGSGYCDFINSIKARKKYALDKYIRPQNYALDNVETLFGDYRQAERRIKNNSLDVIFASNFLEHLERKELEKYIELAKNKLRKDGKLILLQPNYRLAYKEYFDDYTHVTAWSDTSLKDYLSAKGFNVTLCMPSFLPFSMKSSIPKHKLLVRAYLNSPIKPFAKQMLIVARKS